jgi:hypothetical protein
MGVSDVIGAAPCVTHHCQWLELQWAAAIFLSAMMLSATITAAAATMTAVPARADSGGGQMTARVRCVGRHRFSRRPAGVAVVVTANGSGPAILGIGVGDREGRWWW